MKTIKIPEVYAKNEKNEGDNLTHIEWNAISSAVNVAQKTINNLVDDVAAGTGGSGSNSELSVEQDAVDVDKKYIKINDVLVGELTAKGTKGTNVALSGDNNINIEPRPALGDGEGKNTAGLANRKGGNISLKPGDDIELCSHKRGTKKNTEVAVKVIDGSDNPVKLQVFAGDITLTTKGKNKTKKKDATTGEDTTELLYDDPNVMNVNITTGDGKGYLKVRAQAIDLRCEDHGGIALQPKGNDGEGHMNKIKFEHGGGDGLEFGTFNTEKTSIFTDEYRFNKDGVWKMATRVKEVSDKYDGTDATTHYKYQKQADDFYDVINTTDATCTTSQIIDGAVKTAALFNRRYCIVKSVDSTDLFDEQVVDQQSLFIVIQETDAAENYSHLTEGQQITRDDLFRAIDNDEGCVGYTYPTGGNIYWNNTETNKTTIKQLIDDNDVKFYVLYVEAGTFQDDGVSDDLNSDDVYAYEFTIADRAVFEMSNGKIQISSGYKSISFEDVVNLVHYMKTNNQGPWANE